MAVPLESRVAVPRFVVPLRSVTDPVGAEAPAECATVAVSVMLEPASA